MKTLNEFMNEQLENTEFKKEYEKILYSIELKRYKKEILSLKDIEEQLYYILSENVDE